MEQHASQNAARTVVLAVTGMTCGGCASTLTRVLSRVPGVEAAQVDLASGRAIVSGTARAEDLIHAVEAAGFAGRLA